MCCGDVWKACGGRRCPHFEGVTPVLFAMIGPPDAKPPGRESTVRRVNPGLRAGYQLPGSYLVGNSHANGDLTDEVIYNIWKLAITCRLANPNCFAFRLPSCEPHTMGSIPSTRCRPRPPNRYSSGQASSLSLFAVSRLLSTSSPENHFAYHLA